MIPLDRPLLGHHSYMFLFLFYFIGFHSPNFWAVGLQVCMQATLFSAKPSPKNAFYVWKGGLKSPERAWKTACAALWRIFPQIKVLRLQIGRKDSFKPSAEE
jgi:hypothetical protein